PIVALTLSASGTHDFDLQLKSVAFPTSKEPSHQWQPLVPPAYRTHVQKLSIDGNDVTMRVFAYRKSDENKKLLPYISSLFEKRQWRALSSSRIDRQSQSDQVQITQLLLKDSQSSQTLALWYWFDVGGYSTANYSLAKL